MKNCTSMERMRLLPNLGTGFDGVDSEQPDLYRLRTQILELEAFITDFDGVHTNNLAMIGFDGFEYVQVNRSDGLGYKLLSAFVKHRLIISSEDSPLISARAKKLNSESIVGARDKAKELDEWATAKGVDLGKAIFIGNDINDLEAMKLCGVRVAVADAVDKILDFCPLQTSRPGGYGAIREVIDWMVSIREA